MAMTISPDIPIIPSFARSRACFPYDSFTLSETLFLFRDAVGRELRTIAQVRRSTAISKIVKEGAGRRTARRGGKCGLASAVSSNRVDNLQAALEPRRIEWKDRMPI